MAGELTPATPGPTAALAAFAAGFPARELPEAVRHEARRALVNGFATALAGWDDPALRAALTGCTAITAVCGAAVAAALGVLRPCCTCFQHATAATHNMAPPPPQ